jgi:hypothetical protein
MDEMRGQWLTAVSAASIQPYMFSSNKLKENAGASEIVDQSLRYWNSHWAEHGARRVYVGGGNALLIFRSEEAAIKAIRVWSEIWLRKAPGLRLVAANEEIAASFEEAHDAVFRRLAANSNRPRFGSEPGALAVVRACASTGLAASRQDEDKEWISVEAFAKREFDNLARERFRDDLRSLLSDEYSIPVDFENIGRNLTHIAVVHADGDGIGDWFRRAATEPDPLRSLESLSDEVDQVAHQAFGQTLADLIRRLTSQKTPGVEIEHGFLPVRPLVHGGDDLTFVCHGKLGLWLGVKYLRHFREMSGGKFTASAGVAIVPLKFPFARAYELASALTSNAKSKRRKASAPNRQWGWIDFQLVMEGVPGNLVAMRSRQYTNVDGDLLLNRPYCLREGDDPGLWDRFERLWADFGVWPRSRAKQLLDALMRGGKTTTETEIAFNAAGIKLPDGVSPRECWDPLELLDFHVKTEEQHAATKS